MSVKWKKCPHGLKRGEPIPGTKPQAFRNYCSVSGCLMQVSSKRRLYRLLVCDACSGDKRLRERRRFGDCCGGGNRGLVDRQSAKLQGAGSS